MISQDILKRAAAAGALGAVVLGGAVWVSPDSTSAECEFDRADWGEPIDVKYVPEERMAPPVARRAPPPEGVEEAERDDSDQAAGRRAELEARRDALRRAIERLARMKRMRRNGSGEVNPRAVRKLERRIDRAIDAASHRAVDER